VVPLRRVPTLLVVRWSGCWAVDLVAGAARHSAADGALRHRPSPSPLGCAPGAGLRARPRGPGLARVPQLGPRRADPLRGGRERSALQVTFSPRDALPIRGSCLWIPRF